MDTLGFISELGWAPLPPWARYLVNVGLFVARMEADAPLARIGIALPSRHFASHLVAAGVVLGGYEREESRAPETYFKMLLDLPEGTAVSLRSGTVLKKGKIVGSRNHVEYGTQLGVQVEERSSGGQTSWLHAGLSNRVEVLPGDVTLPKHQKGLKIAAASGLVEEVVRPLDAARFTENAEELCVVVARRTPFVDEASTLMLAARSAGAISAGAITELLRIQGDAKDGGFRTVVTPVSAKSPPKNLIDLGPTTVIFEGPVSYLRWRHGFEQAHWIVLLDRTEPRFAEAAAQLDADFIERRTDELSLPPATSEIAGLELMAHREPRGR
ncbi:MAG: hypothetical protein R2706_19705 [Acidimicrobiales bacterium]